MFRLDYLLKINDMNIIDKLNSLNVGESCYYMSGITLKCVEDNSNCTCCHFRDKDCFTEINCAAVDREDGKNVVFAAVLDDMEKIITKK